MDITTIRKVLESYYVFPCKLYHEKVMIDKKSGIPHILYEDREGIVYNRVKICDLHLRNHRLGCAHSISNKKFKKLLNPIAITDSYIKEKQELIDEVVQNIYNLDHQKGNLESEIADVLSMKDKERNMKKKIAERIAEIEKLHDDLMNQLDQIRSSIFSHLDKLILDENTKQQP